MQHFTHKCCIFLHMQVRGVHAYESANKRTDQVLHAADLPVLFVLASAPEKPRYGLCPCPPGSHM